MASGGICGNILEHFMDENDVLHEVITTDNRSVPGLLGGHANPGHTIEDMGFMMDVADLLERPETACRKRRAEAGTAGSLGLGQRRWQSPRSARCWKAGVTSCGGCTPKRSIPPCDAMNVQRTSIFWIGMKKCLTITSGCFPTVTLMSESGNRS